MTQKQGYLAKLELNKKNRLASGLVSEKFPNVSEMVIHMTYFQKASELILMERTVNVTPNDFAYFNMECMMKECLNGGFELGSVISNLVKKRKKTAQGKLVCSGKGDFLSSGHASISYEISIKYR